MSFQEVWVLSIVNRELGASLVAQWKKRSPAVQETQEMQVGSLGREDPPEEGMATHSSILVRKIPWTEELGGLQSLGVTKNWMQLST